MRSRNVESRQLGAWLFAGMTAPVALFAGGMSWQTVAIISVSCLTICWLVNKSALRMPKWLCLAEMVWLIVVLTAFGRWITGSWPSGNVYPAVPLTLLVLGAICASRGDETAGRAGSIVFWLMALIYGAVVAAGLGDMEVAELLVFDGGLDPRLVAVMLLPCLAAFVKRNGRDLPFGSLVAIGAWTIIVSALVTGGLSLRVSMNAEKPLYKWLEGLSILGTLQRFESLVSVALTMGWFAVVSFVLCVGGALSSNIKEGSFPRGVWGMSIAAGIITTQNVVITTEMVLFGSVLMWVIMPMLTVLFGRNKKFEISKNNA